MPRALVIETSGRVGSVATVLDGAVVAERQFAHGLQNAAMILPIIDELCRQQTWQPSQIDHVYVSVGPGSFTGLRIGVTIAKTLAISIGAKIVAVPTVQVLARNAPADAVNAIIVLDAKRDQVFTARFARDDRGEWTEREPAHLDSLSATLQRSLRPVHLIGEGIPHHERFIPRDDAGVIVTDQKSWIARASALAEIGAAMAARGEFIDPDRLTPIYIRLPEAEEKWREKHAGA